LPQLRSRQLGAQLRRLRDVGNLVALQPFELEASAFASHL
jgi:hypothetical protein